MKKDGNNVSEMARTVVTILHSEMWDRKGDSALCSEELEFL